MSASEEAPTSGPGSDTQGRRDHESLRPFFFAAGGFLALAALFFAPVLFGGDSFFGRDVTPFFRPMKRFLVEEVRAGRLPLWNPRVAGGEPFFASLQPGLLYPGSLILYLLPFRFAFDLLTVAHYPLAGLGAWLLLRRWGRSPAAAALGGVGFMLGGYVVSSGNYLNNLQTVAWIPWLFWAWDRWLADGRHRALALFSVLSVVAFLGGEPQVLGLGLGLVFLHGLLRIERRDPGPGRRVVGFAAAGALALSLAGVQLVPFVEYVAHSVRAGQSDMAFAASVSMEPRGLLHLFLPPALGAGLHGFTTRYLLTGSVPWILSPYPGAVIGGLAVVGLAAAGRRRALFWVASGMIGLIVALGAHTPVYPLVFNAIPGFGAFRYPEKFLLPLALGAPVLAAWGLDAMTAGRRPRSGAALVALGALGLVAGAVLTAAPGLMDTTCSGPLRGTLACDAAAGAAPAYAGIALRVGTLVALAGGAFLALRGPAARRAVAIIVLAAGTLDLAAAHRAVNPVVERGVYDRRPWADRAIAASVEDRSLWRYRGSPLRAGMGKIVQVRGATELSNLWLNRETMAPNMAAAAGWLQQDGLQGVELHATARLEEASLRVPPGGAVRLLRATSTRWYADPTPLPDSLAELTPIAISRDLPIRIFEVPDPLPRVWLAAAYEVRPDPVAALGRTLEADLPLGRTVVLEEEPPLRPETAGEARLVEAGPDRLRVDVRTPGASLLVVQDQFYPGWVARVNGVPSPILRASGVFRAIPVPAGASEVELEFAPVSLELGALLSLVGLLVLAGLVRRPSGSRPGAPS